MKVFISAFQENFFDIQEALQAIHMRQEMLREQLAFAKSKGEETVGRNLQVGHAERPEAACKRDLSKSICGQDAAQIWLIGDESRNEKQTSNSRPLPG